MNAVAWFIISMKRASIWPWEDNSYPDCTVFRIVPLPIPKQHATVSHPERVCASNICGTISLHLQTVDPISTTSLCLIGDSIVTHECNQIQSSSSTNLSTSDALLRKMIILAIPGDDKTRRSPSKITISSLIKCFCESLFPPKSLYRSNNSDEFQIWDLSAKMCFVSDSRAASSSIKRS